MKSHCFPGTWRLRESAGLIQNEMRVSQSFLLGPVGQLIRRVG